MNALVPLFKDSESLKLIINLLVVTYFSNSSITLCCLGGPGKPGKPGTSGSGGIPGALPDNLSPGMSKPPYPDFVLTICFFQFSVSLDLLFHWSESPRVGGKPGRGGKPAPSGGDESDPEDDQSNASDDTASQGSPGRIIMGIVIYGMNGMSHLYQASYNHELYLRFRHSHFIRP